jgi:transposase
MSLRSEGLPAIPKETVRLAHIVCPKGDLCLWIGDELSEVFQDPLFAALFPRRGQPAEAPWRLALVTVLQFVARTVGSSSGRCCSQAHRLEIRVTPRIG